MSAPYARPAPAGNLAVALAYIKQYPNRKLFPAAGKGRPCIKDNLARASNDLAQLAAWAKEFSGCIFCCVPRESGIICLDTDLQKPGAKKALDSLVNEIGADDFGHTILDTETNRTPHGGMHLIFEGEHKFSQSKLGAGLDVPNYFVIPGQLAYRVEKDLPAMPCPPALQARIKPTQPERPRSYSGEPVPLDTFKQMLAATPYKGGPSDLDDRHSYGGWLNFLMAAHEAACGEEWGYLDAVIDWSLADPSHDWTQPTSAEYIERKWQSFNESADNKITRASWFKVLDSIGRGDLVGEAGLEDFRDDPSDFTAPANDNEADGIMGKEAPALEFSPSPFKLPDPKTIEPRDWLYGLHYIRKFVVADVAPGGTIKTSNALVEAVAMATGKDLLDIGEAQMPPQPLKVWYWSGEDTKDEIDRRLCAVVKHYSEPDDFGAVTLDSASLNLIEKNLFIDTGRAVPIKLAIEEARTFKLVRSVVEALVRAIEANRIDVLIIDPFIDSHSIAENDNNRIESVVAAWREIAERANCCICLVHHTRKGKPGGSIEYGAADARGATALVDGVRDVRVYNVMTDEEADRYHVPKSECWRYVRVDSGKPNMAARGALSHWRQIASVSLDNARPAGAGELRGRPADSVGVVTLWEPPIRDPLSDAVQHEKILRAARRLFDEGTRITYSQGRNSIGKMVAAFRTLTELPEITKADIVAALEGAVNAKPATWRYQDAKTGSHLPAGYYPVDGGVGE